MTIKSKAADACVLVILKRVEMTQFYFWWQVIGFVYELSTMVLCRFLKCCKLLFRSSMHRVVREREL